MKICQGIACFLGLPHFQFLIAFSMFQQYWILQGSWFAHCKQSETGDLRTRLSSKALMFWYYQWSDTLTQGLCKVETCKSKRESLYLETSTHSNLLRSTATMLNNGLRLDVQMLVFHSTMTSPFLPNHFHYQIVCTKSTKHQTCQYSGPLNMEASIFQASITIHTHAVECYAALLQSSCFMLVRKADQRLALCIPV